MDIPFILATGVSAHHGVDRRRHVRTSTRIAGRSAVTVRVVLAEDDVLVRQGVEAVLASAGDLTLVTSMEQLVEVQRVLGYEKLQRFVRPEQAQRLVANLRRLADFAEGLPHVIASTDASDNLILATAIAGNATHLATGDRADLLNLGQVEGVLIITVRQAIDLFNPGSISE